MLIKPATISMLTRQLFRPSYITCNKFVSSAYFYSNMKPTHHSFRSDTSASREIKIPVPWGHLAAKVWGPLDGIPVLALHGWLENAGSFDRLAPLLPGNICLVCLDFCGNGLSSPYPPGTILTHFDCVCHVKMVSDYFEWKKFSIIAHSMGGIMAIYFAASFPEMVEKLVCIDIVKQTSHPAEKTPAIMRDRVLSYQSIFKRMEQGTPKTVVTYEQARSKLVTDYRGLITPEDADVLLIRGLEKVGEGDEWVLTRDLRAVCQMFTSDELLAIAIRKVSCPFLYIKPIQSLLHNEGLLPHFVDFFRKAYLNSSAGFRLVELDGHHNIHLSLPHVVAPHINNFLSSTDSKL